MGSPSMYNSPQLKPLALPQITPELSAIKPDSKIIPERLSHILDALLQLIGLVAAFVFGVWAIRSYNAATLSNTLAQQSITLSNEANGLALIATQIAVYSGCLQLAANTLQFASNISTQEAANAITCAEIREAFSLASVTSALSLSPSLTPTPAATLHTSLVLSPASPPISTPTWSQGASSMPLKTVTWTKTSRFLSSSLPTATPLPFSNLPGTPHNTFTHTLSAVIGLIVAMVTTIFL